MLLCCLKRLPGLACLAALISPVFASDQVDVVGVEGRIVEAIRLESDGPLTTVAVEDLIRLLEIKRGDAYSRSAVRRSMQRIYSTRAFHDVQVSAEERESGGLELKFVLIRKYRIRKIDISGSFELPREELRRVLSVRVGEPYNHSALELSRVALRRLYQEKGYYRAVIEPEFKIEETRALIDLNFRIQAGLQARVASLALALDGGLEEQQIQELMRLRVGGLFSQSQLNDDLETIRSWLAQRGFLNAFVRSPETSIYDPERNQVDLTIRATPRNPIEVRFEGEEPSDEMKRDLPLFAERSDAQIFLQETAAQLAVRYQEQGYLAAKVDFEVAEGSPRSIVFRIDKGRKLKVKSVAFSGNQFADSLALRQLLAVRESRFLSRGRLTDRIVEDDVRRIKSYYQQRGFLDADVERRQQIERDELSLVYEIDEGKRYQVDRFQISGNHQISDAAVEAEIQMRSGEPFSPIRVAQDRANVIALYENQGYRQVDFRSEVIPKGNNQVELRYWIREGTRSFVDEVMVIGNLSTRKRVIRREVTVEPNKPLSLGAILETEANLYNLAVFNRVQIEEAPSFRDPSAKTVIVNVEEAKKYTLLYGIGYSSFEGPRGTVGVTNNNFLGLARSVSLGVRAGAQRQRANLSYTLPRLFQRRLPTVFSFTADKEKAQTTRTFGPRRAIRGRPFDSFRLIGSVQTERRLSRRESLFFRYRFEQIQLNVPENLAAPLEFFREEENLRLSSLSLSYLNESRDDPSEPSKGFFASGEAMVTSRFVGSEAELLRFFGQGQYYREIRPKVVWASSVRLGVIAPYGRTGSVPIGERFFSGGATTLRGLPQDLAGPLLKDAQTGEVILVDEDGLPDPNGRPVPLGGNALMILNSEIRFPLVGFVRGAVFYDVGDVYARVRDIVLTAPSHSFGAGLLLSTPVGPLRFDLGYNPDPPDLPGFHHFNFQFTLGNPF